MRKASAGSDSAGSGSAGDELLDAGEGRFHVLAGLRGAELGDELGLLVGEVPDLPHAGARAALDRLELVTPDAAADSLSDLARPACRQAMRRLSSSSMTVLTIEYGMPIFIDMPNVSPSDKRSGAFFASRTVPEPSMS